MKTKKYILIIFLTIFSVVSCNDDKILEEVPIDFYGLANAYNTPEGIDLAIFDLYKQLRHTYERGEAYYSIQFSLNFGTDFGRDARAPGVKGFENYTTSLVPGSEYAIYWWENMYKIISGANVIIELVPEIEYSSEKAANKAIAEAMFFRGYAYRFLAFLYGGVPITLKPETSAKRDFVRATREEVYAQAIFDLIFASEHLPDINGVENDGRVSKEAALHFLAEIYLADGQLDNSINAASQVINNPNFQLMTERFGSRASEPGDVWWDLFRRDNQNRSSGNKEAIWVGQYEDVTAGGGVGHKLERNWGPLYWYIKAPDGVAGFIGPTTQNGGYPIGVLRPTYYAGDSIWTSDWDNDMRNSEYNIKRDWLYDNPASAYYGMSVAENPPVPFDTKERDFYSFLMKVTTQGNHPDVLIADPATGAIVRTINGGSTCTDQYLARLAETYLIRAEAYLRKGDNTNAAADINAVRERANATLVATGEVDIDYILDERMRELALEESRRLTLSRMGKCYERTVKYNTWDGPNMQPYHELFPIPYSEIERNTGAVLEQNPGYSN
jgi:hypothetical protein